MEPKQKAAVHIAKQSLFHRLVMSTKRLNEFYAQRTYRAPVGESPESPPKANAWSWFAPPSLTSAPHDMP